ncbi:hypothetical protein LJ737_09230 [Hymenobacter sp. 15J16-1T3B]|uniref:hypothetical protein n=1 Tax=Hymenobacter sp. 15J16-1T3B TaxID=2886941 RepID=UPI001D100E2F|nr:hypothetical protein [Hymenobacter sp. 15J16-1T3B]MCC3157422.1 hypothetical protein [Hymenobacter sp. 15J16-1T3B]
MRFFATKHDLLPFIIDVESRLAVRYCATGLFDTSDVLYYSSLALVPELGIAEQVSAQSPNYLVLASNSTIQTRAIPQRKGSVNYAIDQLINPDTITIRPGGIFRAEVLIEGTIGTASKSKYALSTYKFFRRTLTKHFKKLEFGCYIGSEAESFLKQGWRLVQSELQPKEYDQKAKGASD